jgi:hypothetical protein
VWTLDAEPTAERLDPVSQAAETCAARHVGAADPVIGDFDPNGSVPH